MTQTFEIKGVISGNVLKTVTHPAVIIETEYGRIEYIGEADEMTEQLQQLESVTNSYRRSAQKLVIVELPHDQDEVQKAFSVAGYALELYKTQQIGVKPQAITQGDTT